MLAVLTYPLVSHSYFPVQHRASRPAVVVSHVVLDALGDVLRLHLQSCWPIALHRAGAFLVFTARLPTFLCYFSLTFGKFPFVLGLGHLVVETRRAALDLNVIGALVDNVSSTFEFHFFIKFGELKPHLRLRIHSGPIGTRTSRTFNFVGGLKPTLSTIS